LPTPGEAQFKLAKRLASKVAEPAIRPGKGAISVRDTQAWEAAGLHCSANERRADEASRDVEAWLKCQYMREHLGEEYSGVVSAVTSFGIFVTLDALYVEGLVHITELGGEYFKFDEARQELRGERTGIRYSIGARVRVQVSRVDLDGRKIDFRLVDEMGETVPGKAAKARDSGMRASVEESRFRDAALSGSFGKGSGMRTQKGKGQEQSSAGKKSGIGRGGAKHAGKGAGKGRK
jgi:ribonuclease R